MSQFSRLKKNSKGLYGWVLIIGFIIGSIGTNISIGNNNEEIHISIVYGSEKANWMTIAYSNFMKYWTEHHEEKIFIDMQPYGSSDSIISILNGEIFPTIWSPASAIWLPLLNTKWAELTGDPEPIVNIDETVRIIYSPIVIATWKSINDTYGIKGLQDIHDLSINPSIQLKMAHTDPRLSNSGFMTVIMATSVCSGIPSEDLEISQLTDPNNQLWMKEFESRAVQYGKSTGFLAKYMEANGPSALSLAFVYENLMLELSQNAYSDKIIAIYPEEGTLYSDHPFCILNANWITPQQRMVAEAFLEFINQTETVQSAMDYGFRPIDPSIPLDPNIFNYDKYGIQFDVNIPEMKSPKNGEVLLKIPDFWLLCKATA